MGTLGYTAAISLDGYVADASGDFQWTAPCSDVFDFHVERMAATAVEILGRTTHELMTYWESQPEGEQWSEAEQEFARRWCAIERVVVSQSLPEDAPLAERVRRIHTLPLDELERIVAEADADVEIFGPTTAARAILANRVHDYRFFVVPRVVGGGLRALPDGAVLNLELHEHRIFDDGTALLHYRAN